MRKDGSYVKAERLGLITKTIVAYHNQNNNVSYRKMLVFCQYKIGLSKQKASEYLDLIIEAKDWGLNNDIIEVR